MGKINILLANADNYFSEQELRVIQDAIQRAEEYVSSSFTAFDYSVDILVARPTLMQGIIPEDGICGRTFNSRLITIVIDNEQAPVNGDRVFETACHELSHSLRWGKVHEYAETLYDEMILEGLAVAFEERALKDNDITDAQFFLHTILETTQEQYDQMIKVLQPVYSDTRFNYDEIFYSGNANVPRWAGYRLGYYYVMRYLDATGLSIEEATLDSYKEFLKAL